MKTHDLMGVGSIGSKDNISWSKWGSDHIVCVKQELGREAMPKFRHACKEGIHVFSTLESVLANPWQ